MSSSRMALSVLVLGSILVPSRSTGLALGADEKAKPAGTVSGIVIDRGKGSITVKADGEESPVKYVFDPADQRALQALEGIFPAARAQLKYEQKGETRRLTGIRSSLPRSEGTITGVVIQPHDWWVEVKPKNGPPDAFAAHFPFDQNKPMMDRIKGLKKGDVVMIRFTTDFERHRIEALQVRAAPKKK